MNANNAGNHPPKPDYELSEPAEYLEAQEIKEEANALFK